MIKLSKYKEIYNTFEKGSKCFKFHVICFAEKEYVLKFRTLYSIIFFAIILLFMQLFLKILSGLANGVDPD